MKNNILIIFTILIVCLSCNSQLQVNQEVNLFEKKIVGNYYLLKKKHFRLTNEGNSNLEKRYLIKIPKDFKSYTSEISVIPNKIVFDYKANQKIIVFGNFNSVKQIKFFELDKKKFKEKLEDLKISISSIDREIANLKEKNFNGINVESNHIILYLNIPKQDLKMFDESIKSFQYLDSVSD